MSYDVIEFVSARFVNIPICVYEFISDLHAGRASSISNQPNINFHRAALLADPIRPLILQLPERAVVELRVLREHVADTLIFDETVADDVAAHVVGDAARGGLALGLTCPL